MLTKKFRNGSESFSVNANASLKTQWAAIAKLGYLFSDCAQIYAFIGPQWAHLKASATDAYSFERTVRVPL